MGILTGIDLAAAVREMFAQEESLRCAVAFWGPEFADLACHREAHVILDISMGGTSKLALEKFRVGANEVTKEALKRVRVLDGLHTKIYLGRERCIVGSANASGRALGHNGSSPTLFEACVLLGKASEPGAFRQVEELWEILLEKSRVIALADYERAPHVARPPAARDWTVDLSEPMSLLKAVMLRPDAFERTAFAFGDHDIDATDLADADQGYEEQFHTTAKADGRTHICSTDAGDAIDVVFRKSSQIVSFWFGRRPGLYAYHDIVRVEHSDDVSYYGRRNWSQVCRIILSTQLSQDLTWNTDEEVARKLARLNGEPRGSQYVALLADEVHDQIMRSIAKLQPKATQSLPIRSVHHS